MFSELAYVALAQSVAAAGPASAGGSGSGQIVHASPGGLALMLLLIAALAAAAFVAYRRYIAEPDIDDARDDELPPLVFPVAGPPRALRRPSGAAHPGSTPLVGGERAAVPRTGLASVPGSVPATPAPAAMAGPAVATTQATEAPTPAPVVAPTPVPVLAPTPVPAVRASAAAVEAERAAETEAPRSATGGRGLAGSSKPRRRPVRAKSNGALRPVDEVADGVADVDATLQLLPGRLEVVAGAVGAEEIRFVRPPGGDAEVTLGRVAGPTPAHVQLSNPTVSRKHARLRYEGGNWYVVNLSRTNPVLVNGQELGLESGGCELTDGDRLELGEVVLRFRCR
jgi:hypothetical protein